MRMNDDGAARAAAPPPKPDLAAALKLLALWLAAVLFGAFLLLVMGAADAPTVYRAWPSGDCRQVVGPNGAAGDCGAPPATHRIVWVSADWEPQR